MKKLIFAAAVIAGAAVPATVWAHDVGSEFDSRGACEAALAQINIEDAEFLVSIGEYETRGQALQWFHDVFDCERQGDK